LHSFSSKKHSCWFGNDPDPLARMRLLCFPHAGGTAAPYYSWQAHFPSEIQVCPVELPGRGGRIGEPIPESLLKLVTRLLEESAPYFDRPIAFFGHSLGAFAGFELAKTMLRWKLPAPKKLFVSACRAPQIARTDDPIHHLEDREFIREMAKMNGTPNEVLKHEELLSVLLPALKGDFRLAETYEYAPAQPLPCAIFAFGGNEDESVSRGDLVAWHSQTTGAFNLHMLPGTHFFLERQGSKVAKLVADALA